ncbi:MAG TPA: ABC transporter substrate-binding protein [Reyranella sp.]|jgi:peptide/nickel transport system substrate-binding protein
MQDDKVIRAGGTPGTTTRREFMTRALASGVTVAAATTAWGRLALAAPAKGGHLRLGLAGGSTTDSLDPSPWSDTFMVMVGFSVRGNLVELKPDGSLRGEAAESWSASKGATVWTFKLRKDVEFSNGKTLSAEDVIASLNHHRGDQSKSGAKGLFSAVSDIKADGNDTVVITLSQGSVDFANSLTDHHVNIMQAKDGKADWQSGIGIGPYVIEAFEPGVRALLKRAPNSYKKAWLDSAEMIGVADVVARQAALTSNRVDLINRADLKTVQLLGKRPGLKIEESAGRLHYSMPMDTTAEPFRNKDLRLALKYAIDREAILKTIFNGHGKVGNDQPITPAYPFHNPNLAARTYDLDKAKFHLKKSGVDGTVPIGIHTADASFNGAVDLCVLYQQQAAKAGISLNVIREPGDGYWQNVARKKPWYTSFWSGRATEDTMFTVAYSAASPLNDTHWKNDDFDKLLAAARVEADEAKRRQMFYDLQTLVSDEGGALVPVFANSVYAMTTKVQHEPAVAGNWELDGARAIERWWMAG